MTRRKYQVCLGNASKLYSNFLAPIWKKIQIITLTRGVNLVRKIYIFYLSLSYITTTTSKRDLWKQADTKSFMTLAFLLNRESHDLTSLRNSKYILPIFGIRVTDYYNKENSNCNRSIIILFLKLSYFLHYFHVNVNLVFIFEN